jgi:DNA polymerase/3'-5' exonuclease PolX
MKLEEAIVIAQQVRDILEPYCQRIAIAGSIRRRKPEVGDIEILAIPKPYEVGLFESGIATIVNKWQKVKGELPCKYTQRILPEGIKLDLFFAVPTNWGYQLAIRTGSAEYSHKVLASTWAALGYKGVDGHLTYNGEIVVLKEEADLFNLLDMPLLDPALRTF